MPCYHPLRGYRSGKLNPSGKRSIVFNRRDGVGEVGEVTVPCGQCVGCRLERSRQWAIRCVHEASLHEHNCFVTLTYSDEFLPHGGSLVKSDFQNFMKRLRKGIADGKAPGMGKVRYFHCGEYGDRLGRPHYHALLFGFDFPDKQIWTTRKGHPVWRSSWLEELWSLGQSELGSVTFESAAYVARYVLKKRTGEGAKEHYEAVVEETGEVVDRTAEYVTMSRGGRVKGAHGIGAPWFAKFGEEVYPDDEVIVRGRAVKPPKYYDNLYEIVDAQGALDVARARRRARRLEDETPERLEVREKCAIARLENLKREVE